MIGASAAVSGMMAAAARFIFAAVPGRHRADYSHHGPRQSLLGLVGIGERRCSWVSGLRLICCSVCQ